MFNCRSYINQGQGLLETVVAIGIILSGLIGVVALAVSNLTAGAASQNRLAAVNLAREGIEAARAIRDNAWLSGPTVNWYQCSGSVTWPCLGYTANSNDVTAIAILEPTTFSWSMYFAPNDFTHPAALIYRDQNSLYRQAPATPVISANPTAFRRLLQLYPICRQPNSNNETSYETVCSGSQVQVGVRVVAEVRWVERDIERNLVLEDFLYNWRYAPIANTP